MVQSLLLLEGHYNCWLTLNKLPLARIFKCPSWLTIIRVRVCLIILKEVCSLYLQCDSRFCRFQLNLLFVSVSSVWSSKHSHLSLYSRSFSSGTNLVIRLWTFSSLNMCFLFYNKVKTIFNKCFEGVASI